MKVILRTLVGILSLGWAVSVTEGQTLLQRLNDRLNQQTNPPAAQPAPPAVLPPPVVQNGRPTLGIHVGPVTDEIQQAQRLTVRRGAVVSAVERNSPAERAGLPLGAVIVAFDGRRIDTPDDLIAVVQQSRPGQEVELTFYDRDRLSRKRLVLGGAPGTLAQDPAASPLTPPPLPTPSPQGQVTRQASPTSPLPQTPQEPNLEGQLGAGGSRPLLGRIGRVIDNLATPAQALSPVPAPAEPVVTNRVDADTEVRELRRQVLDLSRELEDLRRHVLSLEKQIRDRDTKN